MKKFLKALRIILIILLVGGVIAGTCLIFFKNLKKSEEPIAFVDFVHSEEKAEFDDGLRNINAILVTKYNDQRLSWANVTMSNLDKIVDTLSSYIIQDGNRVTDSKIVKSLGKLKDYRDQAQDMIDEYIVKIVYHPTSLGFNDLYEQLCEYIEEYSTMVIALDNYVVDLGVNKASDLKFNMIDVYARIAKSTFADVDIVDGQLSKVSNPVNMDKINSIFRLDYGYMLNTSVSFSKYVNEFDMYYSMCDKPSFAKNFVANLASVGSSIQNDSSDEIKATYFFEKLYVGV